jgi:LacI family transcriptional regulator
MAKSIGIQDIANHLEISRNTVSKALNDKPLPEKTRQAVLNAAIELGYKSYHLTNNDNKNMSGKKVLILSSRMLLDIYFHLNVMRGIENTLQKYNIELLRFTFSPSSEIDNLKKYIEQFKIDGIMCIEFFDKSNIEQVLSLGYPTIFLDFCSERIITEKNFDILMMENIKAVKYICCDLMKYKKCKTFGFVGDYRHCQSFYERYLGMMDAMVYSDLVYSKKHSILKDDSFPYGDDKQLATVINKENLPDCFVCANDSIAVSTINALKLLNVQVPKTVKVLGFDNTVEGKLIAPSITTINVDKFSLGKKLVQYLIQRIQEPKQKSRTIYIESKLIEREST